MQGQFADEYRNHAQLPQLPPVTHSYHPKRSPVTLNMQERGGRGGTDKGARSVLQACVREHKAPGECSRLKELMGSVAGARLAV